MARIGELEAELKRERLRRQEAEWKLQQMLGKYFAKSSEKIDPAQLQLLLEGVAAIEAEERIGSEVGSSLEEARRQKTPPRSKRAHFPEEMREATVEVDLPEEERICPDTGKERKIIRWEETTKINFVPSHFERVNIRRAVRAVAAIADDPLPEQPVVTAEMPPEYRIIPGCIAAAGLLVHLMVAKYCDHLPFYRIQQIFKRRHKVELDRNTMCHWMKRCAAILGILYEALRRELLSGNYLQIDETFFKLLDPEVKGKSRRSHFWVIKRPGQGVLFAFDPSRSHEVAERLLGDYKGKLQSDGFGAYGVLERKFEQLLLFRCWAHTRRKFYESLEANGAAAAWYIAEIQKLLYRVEREAREASLDALCRGVLRAAQTKPILDRIKEHLDRDMSNADILPSSPLGKAVRYALGLWPGLIRYAEPEHGDVEIDTNEVENAIRPTAVGKNWLFIGQPKAGQTSAIIYTIIENCRLHDIDPMEYLLDVMPRIMDHPQNRIGELLPRAWKEARAQRLAA